jgi:hypothetical protein
MAGQLPDISPWLVTPSNPARSLPGLDHSRCAALHNHILQLAWVGSGRALDELERLSWFERHGDAAQEVRNRLDPSLVSFLEQAYDVDSTVVSFFYWVTGLNNPDFLWQNNSPDLAEPGEDWRFLTLYPVHIEFGGHIDGLK